MSARDDQETPRGLPGPLPAGETLLWQGAPAWRSLARRAFLARAVAIYFALLAGLRLFGGALYGESPTEALAAAGSLAAWGAAGVGVLCLMAFAIGRTTVYTITSRRVVLRIGVALPKTVNLPFAVIAEAALKTYPDGTGDIPLTLSEGRAPYLHLWPHAKPWRFSSPEPMLRCTPDAARVAGILSAALKAASETAGGAQTVASPAANSTVDKKSTRDAPGPLAAARAA
ncbi:MAG: photosynthetic complex putative assembly protein PuhB [Hyphomicrobiales bacterium]|nr:photosynthetic complex putative assembly protein PuhB [Hyphomicrobiales bacterium]